MDDKKYEEAEIQDEDIEFTDTTATQNDPELEDIEENIDGKIKKLRAKLKTCEEEKASHLEDLQRSKADYLNARKRLEDERIRSQDRQIDDFIRNLLPLYDSFKMAMGNQEAWQAVESNWRAGVEGIFGQLQVLLADYKVSFIDTTQVAFDPNRHEAVGEEVVSDSKDNDMVLKIIQDGMVRNLDTETESLIRPARVIVGTFNQANEKE